MRNLCKQFLCSAICSLLACQGLAANSVEILPLDVITYEQFIHHDEVALTLLKKALLEKGVAGIRGIPGYKEKVADLIESARLFSALPEEVKENYAPNREQGDLFLGYEKGKEKFQRPDGTWVVDDLKTSFYAFVPENPSNKWPDEMDLSTPFEALGGLMLETGEAVMKEIGLINDDMGITIEDVPQVCRLLYYRKSSDSETDNPFWCGAHFDHCMFTALLPAFYFEEGQAIPEPMEAGLFIKTTTGGEYKKVVANDPDVLLFQVGEFGQLVADDAIRATEHRVHKANGSVERYTMALFLAPGGETTIHSNSVLTEDTRYGSGGKGSPCTFQQWAEASFNRYIVK